MTRDAKASASTTRSLRDYDGPPPANYERYFVPAIGRPLAVELVEAAALRAGERVLDVACGTGVVARLAAEQVGAGGFVTGVDANPGMLAVAGSVPAAGATIQWHEADAAATGLPGAAYDAALCQLGLQFFADRTAALREMRRLLALDGRIVVNVAGPAPPMFEILEQVLADRVSRDAAGFIATVFSLFEPSELERLLDRAGFDEISVERRTRSLRLAPPAEFLWQYVSSTPPRAGARRPRRTHAHRARARRRRSMRALRRRRRLDGHGGRRAPCDGALASRMSNSLATASRRIRHAALR